MSVTASEMERAQIAHTRDLREEAIYKEHNDLWREILRNDITLPRLQEIDEVVQARILEVMAWPMPGRMLFELETLQKWVIIERTERAQEACLGG